MKRDFVRYPKYKELYIRAFERMIKNHPGEIRMANGELATNGGEMFAEWQKWCTFGGRATESNVRRMAEMVYVWWTSNGREKGY